MPALEAPELAQQPTIVVVGSREAAEKTPNTKESVDAAKLRETVNVRNTEDALRYFPSLLVRKRHIGDTQAPLATRTSGVGASVTALPPGFKLMASTTHLPDRRRWPTRRAFYAVQFHPEVTHTKQGAAILQRFVHESAAAARLEHARLRRRSRAKSARRSAAIRDPRPVGRRRLVRRRGADPSRDRRAAHLRVRRPRAAAPGRGEAGHGTFARAARRECDPRRRRDDSWRAGRRRRPEQKRKIIGREFVDVFQAKPKKLAEARIGSRRARSIRT